MSLAEERRSFLLSMTLTELALILFFLLLLLSVWQLQRKDEALKALVEPRLRERVEILAPHLARLEDQEFFELVREVQNPARSGGEDHVAGLREERDAALARLSELESTTVTCVEQHADLMGQLRHCQRKLGGLDHPPCWADKDTGRIEFLYRITLREADLEVAPAWPDHREAEALEISGAMNVLGSMDLQTFETRAAPVLRWSEAQNPECRHFARLVDQAVTKDGYKKKRRAIENYFYKFEESVPR